jgi:hypothetical protein
MSSFAWESNVRRSIIFPDLSLTKERSTRASRAAGEVSLNSAVAEPLQADHETRALGLSLTLSLDKERELKGASFALAWRSKESKESS